MIGTPVISRTYLYKKSEKSTSVKQMILRNTSPYLGPYLYGKIQIYGILTQWQRNIIKQMVNSESLTHFLAGTSLYIWPHNRFSR